MSELGGFDFVFSSDLVEGFGGDYAGCWHEAGSVAAYVGVVWGWVYIYYVFSEFGSEDVEVHGIAERIEGLVGIFNGEFVDSWICHAGVLYGAVEMCSMA